MIPKPTAKEADGDSSMQVCQRLAALRMLIYGRRGRAKMAHAIGVSPSTYNYYEKNRVPPADLLAKIAQVTGARLEWLITGEEPKFDRTAGAEPAPLGAVGQAPARPERGGGLLSRLENLLKSAPRLEQPVAAFVRMLEEMAGVDRPERGEGLAAVPEGLIPVLGGTAAGVAHFWSEYAPGGAGVTTLEERVREVLGRGLVRGSRPAALGEGAWSPTGEALSPAAEERTAGLVQVTQPDGMGVVEFVDCPYVRARLRDVFGLRVDGDSMAPRYRDGDIVLLSPREPAREGQPAVVKLKGQIGVTCKVYVPRGDQVHLVPVNENYPATEHPQSSVEWALAVLWRVVIAPGA